MTSYGSITHEQSSKSVASSAEEATPLINGSVPKVRIGFETASWWSKLVFGWFGPLLVVGNEKKKLDPEDLDVLLLPKDCTTDDIMATFDKYWEVEKQIAAEQAPTPRGTRKSSLIVAPSLLRSLSYSFGLDFARAGVLKLIHDVCIFVGPQVLNGFIYFLRDKNAPISQGFLLTLAVTLSQLTMSFCLRHYFFKCYLTGLRIRTAVVVAVYKKALVLASAERQIRSLGEITNLMSIDAQRMQDLTTYLHAVWYSFVQIGLALYFLWQQLGPSCLGGVMVILIMMPVTKAVAKWMGAMQKKLMKAKDERVQVNSEVLGSMKVIKLQGWEESFQSRILELRDMELRQLRRYVIGSSFSIMLWSATPLAVALGTFAAYIWSGNELEVASALTSLALFDILRFPLFMLPQVINRIVEGSVSLARINSFLLCDEHEPVGPGDLDGIGVKLSNASFAYESKKPKLETGDIDPVAKDLVDTQWEVKLLRLQLQDAENCIKELSNREGYTNKAEIAEPGFEGASYENLLCLKRINFECKEGEFVAIVGGVGCGKSSFLNAILGEIRGLSGSTAVNGSLSYFSQSPFILNATVRENILFGHRLDTIDEARYQRALDCCALTHDLEMLPAGDMTEIGEKGITLSGGQKARVAMARAVYHAADICLLDDPLAAVDAHVGKHLFQKCIVDELFLNSDVSKESKKRTVILVTNALQYLSSPLVDRIVVIRDGRVAEQGSYRQLSKGDTIFSRYLAVLAETGVSPTTIEGCDVESIPALSSTSEIFKSNSSLKHYIDSASPPEKPLDPSVDVAVKSPKHEEKPSTGPSLMTNEFLEREVGHVGRKVYLSWANAAGGSWIPIVIVVAYGAVEAVNVLSKWWLTYWSQHGGSQSQARFLAIYALINLAAIVTTFLRLILIMVCGLRASRNLFSRLLDVVLRAPMSFFDTTPIGRIINRFSKDMYTVDEQLMSTLRSYLSTLFAVFSTIIVISGVTPVFTICLIPILIFYLMQQSYFTITYRELKRMDSVNRSPIYALLGETLDGVSIIRAFSSQDTLSARLVAMLDTQQHAYYLTTAAQSWLAVRLELVGTLVITFACLCSVLQHGTMGGNESFAGLAGLSISFALSVTQALNWSVRMASDFEADMVSVERIEQYCNINSEAPRFTDEDKKLSPSWPSAGEIQFIQVKLRYRPGLPLVLKGLDIHIPARSKVGVVGRTGAGKSTLMMALLRVVELDSGKILLDGIDTKTLGLAKLRSNVAVIPQDPVLFSGTVRTNLDPFDNFPDEKLYEVLSRVDLHSSGQRGDSSSSLSSLTQCPIQSLSDIVSEGGSNFSVGQRQLLVIARALLGGASVVIMDEATAAVDADTDSKIQAVMRTEFSNATCITVAHRLNTIMDSDFILVMDDGRAAEFDTPGALLDKGGMFRDLVEAAGKEGYIE